MIRWYVFLYSLLLAHLGCTQVPVDRPVVESPKFDKRLTQLLSFTVPTMGVQELKEKQNQVLLLDAREQEEYDVSHIPGAEFVGYKNFSADQLRGVPKDTTIVLYCSVGFRSEKIGEQLQKLGYTNVHNLYGSIFEWANQDHPLQDKDGVVTSKVHTYNKAWSKWVEEDGTLIKVW